jgi:hypothetical protein
MFKALSDIGNAAQSAIGGGIRDIGDALGSTRDRARDVLEETLNYAKENPGKVAVGTMGLGALGAGGMMAANALGDASREVTNRYSGYDDGIQEMKDSRQQLGEIAQNQKMMNDINFGLYKDTTLLNREVGRDTTEQGFYRDLALDKQKLKAEEAAKVLDAATQNNQTAASVLASAAANNWIAP